MNDFKNMSHGCQAYGRMLTLLFLFIVALVPSKALAHDLHFLEVNIEFKEDGTYRVINKYDIAALLVGAEIGHIDSAASETLRTMPAGEFSRRLDDFRNRLMASEEILFDGNADRPDISFPEYSAEAPELNGNPSSGTRELHTILFQGSVPPDAKVFTWKQTGLGNSIITITHNGRETFREPLTDGAMSTPYLLQAPESATPLATAIKFLILGFHHIIALDGIDHILFVLGLFLFSTAFRPLLVQITAFTLAHSVTLTLSVFHIIRLPSEIVEPLIALSIAYVGIENLTTTELKWWRPAIVFGFGLMHGLGFAAGLQEAGIPEGNILSALVSFNVGVELGQLAVVALAFLVLGAFRKKSWYRKRVVIPISFFIAAIASFWFIQRSLEIFTG